MGFGFPSERDRRQLQEAMRYREMAFQLAPLSDAQEALEDALEQRRSIEKHLQLQREDILQDLQEAEDLQETLRADQLDLQRAAQEALEQHERTLAALGEEALEAAMDIAEQHSRASLDIDRMAQITEELDAGHFARTLRRAQALHDNAVAEVLDQQADLQGIIRQAEAEIDAYSRTETSEFSAELTVRPPEWLRHLSRENLHILVRLLFLYLEPLYAIYGVSLVFSDGNVSDREVQDLVGVLLTTLGWALYLLDQRENDD